ncbi:YdcF family protein [Mucilaginibacter sp. RS28]|uniref:YdcF family protein n=1 Tax=Mucilaginibacter straminoryzae TaxID=2932774 RepID=A0A9X1X5J8_9SPHI|nr:YdcF family protein [Mucilaginibacter straminoryzae]MCJ8211449.1 YdcF family protein [Mucilaginibacter straminoryzae]
MKFILSKVLLFFLFPLTWIGVLFIIALFVKNVKIKQRLLIATLILFCFFSIPLILSIYANCWDYPETHLNNSKKYSCAIVLGGFSSSDNNEQGYFNGSADRYIQGVQLYESKKASHILISSGSGDLLPGEFREADWVNTQLKTMNIPDSSVLIENRSRNIIENALFTRKLLQEKHLSPSYLLVTSAFHMRRSMLIFKKAGLEVIPYPCNYLAGREKHKFDLFIPAAYTLYTWQLYTKELVGYVVAAISKF